ncbi:MAG TPA: hypothetical protein VES39_06995 [Rhodospirillales bacterium]|nr:hypothetical protein [Rhodospirillales bacterium]
MLIVLSALQQATTALLQSPAARLLPLTADRRRIEEVHSEIARIAEDLKRMEASIRHGDQDAPPANELTPGVQKTEAHAGSQVLPAAAEPQTPGDDGDRR